MIQDLLNNKSEREKKSLFKISFKLLKIAIFLFFLVTSLWGCGQQIFDHNVMSYNGAGGGFELCIDPRYCINNHIVGKNGDIYYNYITTFNEALKLGPFYAFFVWPLALLTNAVSSNISTTNGIPNTASIIVTILIIVLAIRVIVTTFSLKQFNQQFLMQQIQPKIAQIKSKYSGKNDLASKQRMQMELMGLNKKHGINPLAALAATFITLPFFYSMYRVFSSLRIFKEAFLFNSKYKIVLSPFTAIFSEHYYIYIAFIAILIPIQILSFKLPSILASKSTKKLHLDAKAKKQYRQTKIITNVIAVVFAIMAFELPLGIGIYWIFSGIYTIFQTLIVWKIQQDRKKHGGSKAGKRSMGLIIKEMIQNKRDTIKINKQKIKYIYELC